MRMLAEGSIDTAPSQDKGKDKARESGKKLRPNPMNEKNRLRIQAWKSYCDRYADSFPYSLPFPTSYNN